MGHLTNTAEEASGAIAFYFPRAGGSSKKSKKKKNKKSKKSKANRSINEEALLHDQEVRQVYIDFRSTHQHMGFK